jgi:hypothetical protein
MHVFKKDSSPPPFIKTVPSKARQQPAYVLWDEGFHCISRTTKPAFSLVVWCGKFGKPYNRHELSHVLVTTSKLIKIFDDNRSGYRLSLYHS